MQIGTAPIRGFGLQDGNWLQALANGQNNSAQAGFTAQADNSKANATQLPAGVAMIKISTVAGANDSCLLPQALAGVAVLVYNNGASTVDLFGKGTDTIASAATANAYSLTTKQSALFFCMVDGNWGVIKGA